MKKAIVSRQISNIPLLPNSLNYIIITQPDMILGIRPNIKNFPIFDLVE